MMSVLAINYFIESRHGVQISFGSSLGKTPWIFLQQTHFLKIGSSLLFMFRTYSVSDKLSNYLLINRIITS